MHLRHGLPALGAAAAVAFSLALAPAAHAKTRKPLPIASAPAWAVTAAEAPGPASTDAASIRLLEETVVEPLAEGGVRSIYRLVTRVLRPGGLESAGTFGVPYGPEDRLEALAGWTILPERKVLRADSEDDGSDEPYVSDVSIVTGTRRRTIRAPGLTVRGISVFEAVLVRGIDRGAAPHVFGDAEEPCVLSRLSLRVPSGWKWEAFPLRAQNLTEEPSVAGTSWTGRDLAPLPRMSAPPPDEERLPLVWVHWWSPDGSRGYKDWADVGRWFDTLSAPVLQDAGEAATRSAALKPAEGGLMQALTGAFAYAAREIRYVSLSIGLSGYKPRSPAESCRTRYGDCKDKAFLLRALASGWGLRTYPVLVLTRGEGRVCPEVPSPGQFNHCIAAVALPEGMDPGSWNVIELSGLGRLLLLDATDRDGGPGDLRADVQGTVALLVTPGGGRLVSLPVQPPESARTVRSLHGRLDDQGRLVEATLTETWTGTRASAMRGDLSRRSLEDRRRDVQSRVAERLAGAAVQDHRVDGLDAVDKPLVESITFSGGALGRRALDLLLLEPGRIARGLSDQPLDPPPRDCQLQTGPPHEEKLDVTVELPEGWEPEDLPPVETAKTPNAMYEARWSRDGRALKYERTGRVLSPEVEPGAYAAFRDTVFAMNAADARAVVLVKAGGR